MRNTRKIQLMAFNTAVVNHSVKISALTALTPAQTTAVKQRAMVSVPHSSMETYRTNKIYATLIKAGEKNKNNVKEMLDNN